MTQAATKDWKMYQHKKNNKLVNNTTQEYKNYKFITKNIAQKNDYTKR